MKIIFIINSLKIKGGSERVATTLANLFIDTLNADIIIINRDSSYEEVAYPLNINSKVITAKGNVLQFFIQTQKIIESNNPDYIICHNMGKLSLLCSFLKKGSSKLYCLEHVSYMGKGKLIKLISRFLYHKYDKVIVLTKKDYMIYKGLGLNKLECIYNISPYVCEVNNYSLKSNKIVAIGRLAKEKNYAALISAWEKIESKLNGWDLEIYGEGDQFTLLNNLILEKKLKNVYLKGKCDDLTTVYRNSSFIVISSLYEGLSMVLIEAKTFGLPTVSFNCPFGPAELINHDKDGILVENQNIDELSRAILYLAQNPDIRLAMSEESYVSSKKFSSKQIMEQWKYLLK